MTALKKVKESAQNGVKSAKKVIQKLKIKVGMRAHTIDGIYTISTIDDIGVWVNHLIHPDGSSSEFPEKMLFPASTLVQPTTIPRRGILREFAPVFENNTVDEMITNRKKEVRFCTITFSKS